MFDFILDKAPWIPEVGAWVIIFLLLFLLWLIIGFPTLLVQGFFREKRMQFSEFLNRMWEKLDEAKSLNSQLVGNKNQEFLKRRNLHSVHNFRIPFWNNPIRKAARVARKTGKKVIDAVNQFVQACKNLEDANINFSNLNKDIPDPDNLKATYESLLRIMRAKRALIIYSILLLGLIAINTVMMSQVLRGLGLGTFRIYGPFWLYHFLAGLLTLLEAGLGAYQGWQFVDKRATNDQNIFQKVAMTFFVYVLVVFLAGAEGFWYSRLGSEELGESIAIFGFNFMLMHALGFMGFVLPLILFLLGHVAFECYMTVLEGAALIRLERGLKNSQKLEKGFLETLEKCKEELKKVQIHAKASRENLPPVSTKVEENIYFAVEALTGTIEAFRESQKKFSESLSAPITEAETWQNIRRIASRIPLTLLLVGLSIWMQMEILNVTYTGWSEWLTIVLPITQVIYLLVVGHLIGAYEKIADKENTLVFGLSPIAFTLALLAVGIFLSANLYLFMHEAISNEMEMVMGFVMGIGLLLIVLGRDLTEMIAVGVHYLFIGFFRMRMLGRHLILWCMVILSWILRMLEFLLELITLPARWLMKMFSLWKLSSPSSAT